MDEARAESRRQAGIRLPTLRELGTNDRRARQEAMRILMVELPNPWNSLRVSQIGRPPTVSIGHGRQPWFERVFSSSPTEAGAARRAATELAVFRLRPPDAIVSTGCPPERWNQHLVSRRYRDRTSAHRWCAKLSGDPPPAVGRPAAREAFMFHRSLAQTLPRTNIENGASP